MSCAQREIDRQRAMKEVNEMTRELSELSEIRTALITICLDQKLSERDCTENAKKMVDFLMTKRLSCLSEPIFSIEFFTNNGWNPHIHIFTYLDNLRSPGKLAQTIRRLMDRNFPKIHYRTNAKLGTAANQQSYLTSLKQSAKRESQEKDRLHRQKNNIPDYYI